MDHIDKVGHMSNWKETKILKCSLEKDKKKKVLEAMYIATNENINKRPGDIVWAAPAAALCVFWIKGR